MEPRTGPETSIGRNKQSVRVDGLLFDMDGTLVDSTRAIVKFWHATGEELGVDGNFILQTSHGRRTIDVLGDIAPDKATWEYTKRIESLLPTLYGRDAVEIPGGRALLTSLAPTNIPWAIVTSGTWPLLSGWLEVLSLPHPDHRVVADDVKHGKPDPSCYLLGKHRIGLGSESQVLVFEDSPAGIRAGKEAGCRVVGLTTTHTEEEVRAAGAEWVLRHLEGVRVVLDEQGWLVEMDEVL